MLCRWAITNDKARGYKDELNRNHEAKGNKEMKEEILEILDEQINFMMEMINEENDKDLSQEIRSQLMFMKRQIEKQLNTNQ